MIQQCASLALSFTGAPWMLNQVQHDGLGGGAGSRPDQAGANSPSSPITHSTPSRIAK